MRLIDRLAARRIYYHRPLPTLPDILLIDIPSQFSGPGLALDRYYPVILETTAEAHEFEAFLCERRERLIAPGLLDRRPSALHSEDIVFARYSPPEPDWPWLQLCCWPRHYAAFAMDPDEMFARGAYTVDAFDDADDIGAAEIRLLATLGPDEARRVQSIPANLGRA
ncbi:hypothetical protein [Sphingobium sp. TCM1]|uniref:hypothetical protein n=1 Tax=Sphingobium sp. TCM1 TaxID=453246 RepID=UPI0007F378B0|nr:hypothetical protein [Sphingobium sp. TCM1]OAN53505.1 hypothetical protein A7Q26_05670 [Sphingobium sp. TCM1]